MLPFVVLSTLSRCAVDASQYVMAVGLLLFIVACFFVSVNSAENVYSDNGWRPTSIEKVLELQRDFIKTPNIYYENSPKRLISVDDFENKKYVRIIQNNEINKRLIKDNVIPDIEMKEGIAKEDNKESQESIKLVKAPYTQMISFEDTISNWKIEKQPTMPNYQRKPKKIDNSNINLLLNNTLRTRHKNEKIDIIADNNNGTISDKTYKVRESVEEENLSASDQSILYNKRLKYVTPKPRANNNFTANLLDILANYNIRTSDNLRNYNKSLRQNSRNAQKQDFVYIQVPLKVPIGYNNGNHLPVDPLLAVLLSNYGHYIPSKFGFRAGYNNLYGHLASNNIHNNKPFGSYKIFSDTDSFH